MLGAAPVAGLPVAAAPGGLGPVVYSNLLALGGRSSVTGTVTYSNSFEATSASGGDIPSSGGGGSVTVTYANTLGLRQVDVLGDPILVHYSNTLGLSGGNVLAVTVFYSNTLGLRQGRRTNVDGRVDLLGTSRYRR